MIVDTTLGQVALNHGLAVHQYNVSVLNIVEFLKVGFPDVERLI